MWNRHEPARRCGAGGLLAQPSASVPPSAPASRVDRRVARWRGLLVRRASSEQGFGDGVKPVKKQIGSRHAKRIDGMPLAETL